MSINKFSTPFTNFNFFFITNSNDISEQWQFSHKDSKIIIFDVDNYELVNDIL